MSDELEKSVDESWKDSAKEVPIIGETAEKESCGDPSCDHDHSAEHQVDFMNYITSLGFQALIFLGEVPNPVTNELDKHVDQAKFLIDTLTMIKEKTVGNLNEQEQKLLDASVYELQLKYVEQIQKEQSST